MKNPYNDDVMTYDTAAHRYRLTTQGVLSRLGVNLSLMLNDTGDASPSTLPDRWLARSADAVYRYIYKNNPNRELVEYLLAKAEYLRQGLENALLELVCTTLKTVL